MNGFCRRALAVAATFGTVAAASAQSGGGYDLTWSSVDCGGAVGAGGIYKLASSVGQPEPSPVEISGGGYDLTPGFLQNAEYFAVPVAVSAFSIE